MSDRRPTPRGGSPSQNFFFDRAHNIILSLVDRQERPRTILDVGCGTGGLLRKAKILFPSAELIGIDPEKGSVEVARRLLPGATFYVSGAESLPLADASIDLALSTFSFHHWPAQEQGLRQIARVLRPGSRLLLADLWPPFGLSKFTRHFWPSDPRRVLEMFARGGLVVRAQPRRMSRFLVITIGERS
ncbi:MAG: class I SAM-dependent methyltransferase [Conexivisphaerales archaeon]